MGAGSSTAKDQQPQEDGATREQTEMQLKAIALKEAGGPLTPEESPRGSDKAGATTQPPAATAAPAEAATKGLYTKRSKEIDPRFNDAMFGPILKVYNEKNNLVSDEALFNGDDPSFYQTFTALHVDHRQPLTMTDYVSIRNKHRSGEPLTELAQNPYNTNTSGAQVDPEIYVQELHEFNRYSKNTYRFVDSDGEVCRLYETSSWHRLVPLDGRRRLKKKRSSSKKHSGGHLKKKRSQGSDGQISAGAASGKSDFYSQYMAEANKTAPRDMGRKSTMPTPGDMYVNYVPQPVSAPILVNKGSFSRQASLKNLKNEVLDTKTANSPMASPNNRSGVRQRVSFSADVAFHPKQQDPASPTYTDKDEMDAYAEEYRSSNATARR